MRRITNVKVCLVWLVCFVAPQCLVSAEILDIELEAGEPNPDLLIHLPVDIKGMQGVGGLYHLARDGVLISKLMINGSQVFFTKRRTGASEPSFQVLNGIEQLPQIYWYTFLGARLGENVGLVSRDPTIDKSLGEVGFYVFPNEINDFEMVYRVRYLDENGGIALSKLFALKWGSSDMSPRR